MATQKFDCLAAKSRIKALGTVTLTTIANVHVISTPFDKAMLVCTNADLTAAMTVTVTGNTLASGAGTHTVIKTVVFSAALANMEMSVEVDSEEVSYAEDVAGGIGTFLSVCFRVTGSGSNTVDLAVQVVGDRQYKNLTPTGTGVTA
jgi:hypothetical protein